MDWSQISSDFKQKYEGCWCSVLLEGYIKSQIFYLDYVEIQKGKGPILVLKNEKCGEILLNYGDSKSDVVFKLPSIGLYNTNHSVVMIRQKFDRQWKKGVCGNTVLVTPIYAAISNHFTKSMETSQQYLVRNAAHLNEDLVSIIQEPTVPISIDDGINALKTEVAVCLSSEFAIGLSLNQTKDVFILWYYENPIGTVDARNKKIFLKETQFQQEFKDFTNKTRGMDDFSISF